MATEIIDQLSHSHSPSRRLHLLQSLIQDQSHSPEPKPKPEPAKPAKKVKKAKKAALPATGDDAVIAVAGIGTTALAFILTSRFVRKEQ